MKNITINENVLKTVTLRPYKYLSPSVRAVTYFQFCLLMVQVIMLAFTKSYSSLIILACTASSAVLTELIDWYVTGHKTAFNWISAITRGLLIGLLIPDSYSPAVVFIIVTVTLLGIKYAFGGFSSSWLNPAACCVCILWILGSGYFPVLNLPLEQLITRNPAVNLIQNGEIPFIPADSFITNFLNKRVFSFFGVSIPDGYISLFWDTHSSIPAFRFNFITIVSSMLLISFDMISPMVPVIYLSVYAVTVRLLGTVFIGGTFLQGDIILAFMTSGVLFCTFFVMQWNGTLPVSDYGKAVYAVLAGLFSFVVIGAGLSSTGFIFLILLMNVISPVIQAFEYSYQKRYIDKVLLKQVKLVKEGEHA